MDILPLIVPLLGSSLCFSCILIGTLLRRLVRLEWRVLQLETVENSRVRGPPAAPIYYTYAPTSTATATAPRDGDPF